MRKALLLALALVSAAARAAEPVPPPAPAVAAPADAAAAQIEALRQRLLSAQQTIATLERQLAMVKDRAVLADQCRVKNGRLVFIARELIEAYEKRYAQEHHDPLQLGRRRFEFELQALSDAVYDNRAEVTVPLPGEKPAEKPATGTGARPAAAAAVPAAPPSKPAGQ
jgi:hypothetical protein